MEITETGVSGLNFVAIEGRLDTETAPLVERQLLELLGRSGIVLDMAAVRFVSSAGLRILLKAAKAAKAASNGFALCGLQPAVQEVFDISGFGQIITTRATREQALAALG
jgi:anti-anti-sigma factor